MPGCPPRCTGTRRGGATGTGRRSFYPDGPVKLLDFAGVSMSPVNNLKLRFDAFELDEADARLRRDGKPVALAPKAFGVLCALARQPGVLVTKNALLDAVWGHQHVSESVLKTTISQVRAALADDTSIPRYIETASRLGYRFIAQSPP